MLELYLKIKDSFIIIAEICYMPIITIKVNKKLVIIAQTLAEGFLF